MVSLSFSRRPLRPAQPIIGGTQVFQKRLYPVLCLAAVLAALAVLGYLLPDDSGSRPTPVKVVLSKDNGPVVFEHARHEAYGLKCYTCHHELTAGAEKARSCSDCHNAILEPTFRNKHISRFDRTECVVCHHYTRSMKDWGHEKHFEDFDVECTACHHDEQLLEEEPTNCANCHEEGVMPAGRRVGDSSDFADAVHARCADCHQEWFDAKARGCVNCHSDKKLVSWKSRLHRNKSVNNCSTCHKQTMDKLMPSKMDAGHTTCMGCHERILRGPYGKENCAKCHLK